MINSTIEDYLKTIYEIEQELGNVATTSLAKELDISPASATGMIKKLAELKLVTYTPYQGVTLTSKGKKVALSVLRLHRLIELFLVKTLGLPWDEVHSEAEKLEHVISKKLEELIDNYLEHPTHDPHGAPIPQQDGSVPARSRLRLADLKAGDSALVAEVSDRNADLLKYIGKIGLFPNETVTVQSVEPFKGPITIHIAGKAAIIGYEVAHSIFVKMKF
jgi:DtxR family Mn-dependent transcriptional regulator